MHNPSSGTLVRESMSLQHSNECHRVSHYILMVLSIELVEGGNEFYV